MLIFHIGFNLHNNIWFCYAIILRESPLNAVYKKNGLKGCIYLQEIGGSPVTLLFGCRNPSDHIYKDEVEEAKKLGAISNSFTAYSRLQGIPKVLHLYLQ